MLISISHRQLFSTEAHQIEMSSTNDMAALLGNALGGNQRPPPNAAQAGPLKIQLFELQFLRYEIERSAPQALLLMPEFLMASEDQETTVRRILSWLKTDFMSPIVTNISCAACQDPTRLLGNAPATDEEKRDGGSRIDVHQCSSCGHQTRFPRYNGPKLLETRCGKEQEFASVCAMFLRAAKVEARLVTDLKSLFWCEARVNARWIHLDPSETRYNSPFCYQQRNPLSYVFAFDRDAIVDVWKRYIPGNRAATLTRRTMMSEFDLDTVVAGMNRYQFAMEAPNPDESTRKAELAEMKATTARRWALLELEWAELDAEPLLTTSKLVLFNGGTPQLIKDRLLLYAQELKCSPDQMQRIVRVFDTLNANAVSMGDFSFLFEFLEIWPREKLFPVLDLIRLCSIRLTEEIAQGDYELLIKFAGGQDPINRHLALQSLANCVAKRLLTEEKCTDLVNRLDGQYPDQRSHNAFEQLVANCAIILQRR